ncbi:hypothetical protein IJT10_04475 [bacterium]|nr:hypothetical protein [bacterium]
MYNIFPKQFKKFILFVLLTLCVCLFQSSTFAAVIPGEGVPHYVETPDGQLVVTNENFVDTSPSANTSNSNIANTTSTKKEEKKTTNKDLPQEPNFTSTIPDSEVKTEKKSKNFLIISLLILLGGAAVVFLVKKSKGED